jgi:hypothetical protein
MEWNFTLSWESCKYLWSKLSWMKIEWFVENIWVRHESKLFTIMDNIVTFFFISFLNVKNRSTTWWSSFLGCCASICFICWDDWVSNIHNHESISSFVHHHYVISKSKVTIIAIGMWNSSISLWETLLNFVNDELRLVFLVKIVSLSMTW